MGAHQFFKARIIAERPFDEEGAVDNMCVKMAFCIRKITRQVLGVTKGEKQKPKDMWWWNEGVQRLSRKGGSTRVRTIIETLAAWTNTKRLSRKQSKL